MFLERTLPFIATCTFAISGSLAITAPHAFAEFTSTSAVSGNDVAAGAIKVEIVDSNGAVQTSPIVSVANAYPAMSTKTFTLRVKNNGSLPAAVVLHSGNLVDATASSLNSVLVLTLKNGATSLYSGNISGLTHSFSQIDPGVQLTLTVEITWPDLPAVDDNPFQDGGLTFGIVADATQLLV